MSCACKRTVRLGAALIVALATLVLPWAPRAHAETSADVQKQVNVLLDRIRDLHRQAALHVKYMGWWQHIWYPDSRGWQEECMPSFKTCGMDGPPTVTAMHEDHVHVSVY